MQRMSLIEEGPARERAHGASGRGRLSQHQRRGRDSLRAAANGGAQRLRRAYPERFNNKTNGVTPRRWLQQANPFLSRLITQTIGDDWITDLALLRQLLPLAEDAGFRQRFRTAKRQAKVAFASWLKATSNEIVDPDYDLRQPGQADPRIQAATAQYPARRDSL